MNAATSSRRGAALLAAAVAATALTAQQDAPVYNVLSFKLTITGKGSDPNPSDANNTPYVPADAAQEWTYSRVIEGWYEIDAVTERVARDRVGAWTRFVPRRGGRHAVRGTRRDRSGQTYLEGGEGAFSVGYGAYTANERWDADVQLGPPDRSLVMELDKSNAKWTTAFLPVAWLAELDTKSEYAGRAEYKVAKNAALGEEWHFFTDRQEVRRKGNAFLDTRYVPARYGLVAIPPSLARASCAAQFVQLDEAAGGGTVVRGHLTYKIDKPRNVPGTFAAEGVLDWTVRVDLPDVELAVLIPDYETWRPNCSLPSAPGVTSGEPLEVLAQLQRVDTKKKEPLPKIRTLTWRLIGTSREPGIAMNMPYGEVVPRPLPDLSLYGDGETRDPEAQVLIVRDPGAGSRISVLPWDWGGWGTLRVEAELADGRVIPGELLGAPPIIGRQRDIPIPARIPGSKIAMGWLEENGVSWTSDAEDRDASPAGKGPGDGFTLYEEYRGFYWGRGGHLSTDPKTKDLFIRIEPGAAAYGIPPLAKRSGLAVHWTERPEHLPSAAANQRVVNINLGNGATVGPQTALYVTDQFSRRRINDLIPPGSRPASVPRIDLPSSAAMGRGRVPLTLAVEEPALRTSQLTQALLQACGVERPGPSDRVRRLTFVSASAASGPGGASVPAHMQIDGKDCVVYFGNTDLVTLITEQVATTGPAVQDLFFLVGEPGGAHSGPEQCCMRDWYAMLYATREQRDGLPVYRLAPPQTYGTTLGTTRAGTGINAANHPGGSVFGDSAVKEPARQQLAVKDNP